MSAAPDLAIRVGAHQGSGKTWAEDLLALHASYATAARVDRGAAWLDTAFPGWRDRIDADRLDLGDNCDCVLGQLLEAHRGDEFYDLAADHADEWGSEAYPGERWALDHGFDSGYAFTPGGNGALRAEWLRVLAGTERDAA